MLAVAPGSPTSDPEPQVAVRIAAARVAVADQPDAGEAWGTLGMVLQAHGELEEAYESYLEAMTRAPTDFRWPYLAALTDRPPSTTLELLERAHDLGPHDLAVALARADALTRGGRLELARAAYARIAETESAREHADLGLARIALLEGRVETALELLEVAASAPSRNGDLYRLLAQLRQLVGDSAGAADAARLARSFGAGLRPVSTVVDRMLERGTSVRALIDHGRRLSARGDHARALAFFEAAARWDTGAEALLDLGRTALAQGRIRAAIEHFQAGLRRAPRSPDVLVEIGSAWSELGDGTAAERALVTALALRPGHAGAHRALGRLRNRQGRHAEAISHLEEALAREPTRYLVYADLAEAFALLGSLREALEARRRLAVLAPERLANLRAVARLEIEQGELGAAKETLRHIQRRWPDEHGSAFHLAMLLATSMPLSETEAAESLTLAIDLYRLRRHDAACADLVGLAYAANGRFDAAARLAGRARELAKGNAALSAEIDDHLARYGLRQRVTRPRLDREGWSL